VNNTFALTRLNKEEERERCLLSENEKLIFVLFCFIRRMKFRIKFHTQTYSITFDDINEDLSINDLKTKIEKHFSSLKKLNFHLSLNGKTSLDENQTISQSGLVNGDTIYILNEINKDNLSLLSIDQPLTLDEVRDSQTYPILIHRLVEYSQPENEFDYLVIVIHALMLENGFQMVQKKINKIL